MQEARRRGQRGRRLSASRRSSRSTTTVLPTMPATRSSTPHRLLREAFALEELGRELDAVVTELLGQVRTDAGGLEPSPRATVRLDTHAEVVEKNVLQRHDVALHPMHLGHMRHMAAAITQSCQ